MIDTILKIFIITCATVCYALPTLKVVFNKQYTNEYRIKIGILGFSFTMVVAGILVVLFLTNWTLATFQLSLISLGICLFWQTGLLLKVFG